MIINDPKLPKQPYGWFISDINKRIRFGVVNPYYFNKGIIEVAPLMEGCYNNIEKYIEEANKPNCYFIYNKIYRKLFFATKQQAEYALKTRTN